MKFYKWNPGILKISNKRTIKFVKKKFKKLQHLHQTLLTFLIEKAETSGCKKKLLKKVAQRTFSLQFLHSFVDFAPEEFDAKKRSAGKTRS